MKEDFSIEASLEERIEKILSGRKLWANCSACAEIYEILADDTREPGASFHRELEAELGWKYTDCFSEDNFHESQAIDIEKQNVYDQACVAKLMKMPDGKILEIYEAGKDRLS